MTEWDDYAATWDENEGAQAYADAALASLEKLLADSDLQLAGAHVCDFGCGTGLLAERLAVECGSIDAVDSSEGMLDVLKAKVAQRWLKNVRPLAELHTDDRLYDVVVCSSVCGFLTDYPGTLARLVSQLRPGGILVQWDWELDPDEEEAHGLTRDAIRDALETAGLEVLSVDVAFTIIVNDTSLSPLIGAGRKPHNAV